MPTRHFILGTAGHIDHGKSSLVMALTGTDPDRLPEEKRRGMSIELGFAELELEATDGRVSDELGPIQGLPCRGPPVRGPGTRALASALTG